MGAINPRSRKTVRHNLKFPWGTKLKTHKKNMSTENAGAQLIMSNTHRSQKLVRYNQNKLKATVEHIKGKDLFDVCETTRGRQWLLKNQNKVIDDAANIISDLLQRGVRHYDIHAGNIIVQNINGKPALKLIDYGIGEMTPAVDYNLKASLLFNALTFDTNGMLNMFDEQLFANKKIKAEADFKKKFMKKLEEKINNWA